MDEQEHPECELVPFSNFNGKTCNICFNLGASQHGVRRTGHSKRLSRSKGLGNEEQGTIGG